VLCTRYTAASALKTIVAVKEMPVELHGRKNLLPEPNLRMNVPTGAGPVVILREFGEEGARMPMTKKNVKA